MISVAVKGYGIVIWEGDGRWRTFAPSDAMSAVLADRVAHAMRLMPAGETRETAICAALLSISGAHLFAVDCDHEPGGCEGESETP